MGVFKMSDFRKKVAALLSTLFFSNSLPSNLVDAMMDYEGFPDLVGMFEKYDDIDDNLNLESESVPFEPSVWFYLACAAAPVGVGYPAYYYTWGQFSDLAPLATVLGKWPREFGEALIANGVSLDNGEEKQLAKLGKELLENGQIMTLKSLQLYWKLTVEYKNKLEYDNSFLAYGKRAISPVRTQYSASPNVINPNFKLRYQKNKKWINETQVKPFDFSDDDKKIDEVPKRSFFSFLDFRNSSNQSYKKYQHMFSICSAIYLTYKFIYNIDNLNSCKKKYNSEEEDLSSCFTHMTTDNSGVDMPKDFTSGDWKDAISLLKDKDVDTWVWKCGNQIAVRLPCLAYSNLSDVSEYLKPVPSSGPLQNRITKRCDGEKFEQIVNYAGGIIGWLKKMSGEYDYKTLRKNQGPALMPGADDTARANYRDQKRPAFFCFKYKN